MYGSNTAVGFYPEQMTGMNGFIDDLGNFVGGILNPQSSTPGGINPSDPAAGGSDAGDATANPPAEAMPADQPMDPMTMFLYIAVGGVAVYVAGKYLFKWW